MSYPLMTNIVTFEGNTSGLTVLSAPGRFRCSQLILTNDTSGLNMGVRLMGNSAGATGRELTLGGNETLSLYFKTNTVELSCNSSVGGGNNYRVWMLG